MSHWLDRLARTVASNPSQSRRQTLRFAPTDGEVRDVRPPHGTPALAEGEGISRRRALAIAGGLAAAGLTTGRATTARAHDCFRDDVSCDTFGHSCCYGSCCPSDRANGCCHPNEYCANPGDPNPGCCPKGTKACVGDGRVSACCAQDDTCGGPGDSFKCCPGGRVCGTGCCGADQQCVNGQCMDKCPDGRLRCDGGCCDEDKRCVTLRHPDTGEVQSTGCLPYCLTGEYSDGSPITCYVYDPKTKLCKDTCPPDQHCDARGIYGGGCIPKCIGSCQVYDPKTGTCKTNCAPGDVCDWRGLSSGTCQPRCMLSCSPYDSATGDCKDTCGPGKTCRASDDGPDDAPPGTCDCPEERICGHACCPPDWFCVDGSCTQHLLWKVKTPKTVTATDKNVVAANVSCPGPGGCSGTVTIVAVRSPSVLRRSAAAPVREVVLGRRKFKIRAKRTASVEVKLGSKGRALLRDRKKLKARARVSSAGGIESARSFTLKAPPRR